MIETKRQKYIKEKYFKLVDHNPLQYAPKDDELFKLAPHTVMRIINLIIRILGDPEALLMANLPEYIDPREIVNTITRNGPDETDDEFRKRVLEKSKKVHDYR